jgi:hypothetical protein
MNSRRTDQKRGLAGVPGDPIQGRAAAQEKSDDRQGAVCRRTRNRSHVPAGRRAG